jgi:cellobiose phosphorylase
MRDWMVSSWTVTLLHQQLGRYAEVLSRAGQGDAAAGLLDLAAAVRDDFQRHLIRDGVVAGYALFEHEGAEPELLLHPSDTRTGLSYSLLPMTGGIVSGLFSDDQTRHHLALIAGHLAFPDGLRLMDRPVAYHGGVEQVFRRAESAAFFGREIGLMYVHAHIRQAEAFALMGEPDALWQALRVINPVSVAERLAPASPRQRNAYFSSSDAAFRDRYRASAEWPRTRKGTVAFDGGWRIYSSGPGRVTGLHLAHALGIRRAFGTRTVTPTLPASLGPLALEMRIGDRTVREAFPPR